MNAKLNDLLTYANSVYQISKQINSLRRKKSNFKIKASTAIKTIFTGILCQNRSINEMMETTYDVGSLKNIYKPGETRPKTHGLRDCLMDTDYMQLRKINENVIQKAKENKFFRNNLIDGLSVVGFDGVDEFETNKKIEGLPERKHKDGRVSRYYKALGIMHIGENKNLMLGLEELKAKELEEIEKKVEDENKGKRVSEKKKREQIKAEGEITVFKRVLGTIKEKIGRCIDVIVLDALYAVVTVLNCIKENHMEAVIRFKDKRRTIYKDAVGMFAKREPDLSYEIVEKEEVIETTYSKNSHKKDKKKTKYIELRREVTQKEIGKKEEISKHVGHKKGATKVTTVNEKVIARVSVWSDEFDLDGYKYGKVRFIQYIEETVEGKKTIHVITTMLNHPLESILKIMKNRWHIENNGFRTLKDRYNIDHCYVGNLNAIRVLNEIIMLVHNIVELYIKVRTSAYRKSKKSMRILKKMFENEISENKKIYLLFENIKTVI